MPNDNSDTDLLANDGALARMLQAEEDELADNDAAEELAEVATAADGADELAADDATEEMVDATPTDDEEGAVDGSAVPRVFKRARTFPNSNRPMRRSNHKKLRPHCTKPVGTKPSSVRFAIPVGIRWSYYPTTHPRVRLQRRVVWLLCVQCLSAAATSHNFKSTWHLRTPCATLVAAAGLCMVLAYREWSASRANVVLSRWGMFLSTKRNCICI